MATHITAGGYQGLPRVRFLHQALGGYFETYSIGLGTMRQGIESFLSPEAADAPHTRNPLFDALFAGMTAKPLADAFFAMSGIAGALEDDDDLVVRATLRNRWADHTTFRNDLAHAEWQVGWETMEGEPLPPSSIRIKVRDGAPKLTNLGFDTNDIIARINDLHAVLDALRAYSRACVDRQRGRSVEFADLFEIVPPANQEPRGIKLRPRV